MRVGDSPRRILSHRSALGCLCLVLCVLSSPAAAQEEARAGGSSQEDKRTAAAKLMRQGLDQYKKGDLEGARKSFANAWELEQHPAVAANLADMEMRLGRYREAAEHWSFFLKNAPPNRDRSDAEAGLAECRKHVARVDVAVDAGAVVSVDERVVGEAPLPEVWLDAGTHTFAARFADGRSASQQVVLAAGDAQHVALVPNPTASQKSTPRPIPAAIVSSPPPVVPAEKRESSARVPVVAVGAGLTAVALGVGIVFGLKAQRASSDADSLAKVINREATEQGQGGAIQQSSACDSPTATNRENCASLASNVDSAKSARSTAQVAFVAAGVLGAGTLAAYFLWPRPVASGSVAWRLLPWQENGTSGVVAAGSF